MLLLGLTLALLLTFYIMAKVCDEYFIESLDKIAQRFKMSNDAAGATLMAMGSSAPELFISIIALVKPGDHGSIGVGTIVGSALFNILVISGAAAITRKAVLAWQPVVRDIIFYALAIGMLIFAFVYNPGSATTEVSMMESSLFIVLYVAYVYAVVKWRKILPYKDLDTPSDEIPEEVEGAKTIINKIMRPLDWTLAKLFPNEKYYYGVFTVSIVLIAALSWVMVEAAVEMSHILNIPEAIIALTVLAAGTSVPDLISSIVVAKQGRGGMAVSNAFGSNIFDILVGLGVPWLLTITLMNENVAVSTDSLVTSSFILFASLIVVFAFIGLQKWKIGKGTGIIFILLYVVYIGWEVAKIYV